MPRARGGSRAGTEATFGVVHFAGEVIYDATEFVEKNRDEVPSALHDLVLSSNDRCESTCSLSLSLLLSLSLCVCVCVFVYSSLASSALTG